MHIPLCVLKELFYVQRNNKDTGNTTNFLRLKLKLFATFLTQGNKKNNWQHYLKKNIYQQELATLLVYI